MLQNLHVKNLALIDETEVEFSEGLNILTGETGAGKSIIIGSINLALGQRVPKEMLKENGDPALVNIGKCKFNYRLLTDKNCWQFEGFEKI